MKREIAQKAAKWWADCLRNPRIPDNGDKSSTGGMTMALASLLQDVEIRKAGSEDADKFEKALTNILIDRSGEYFCIGVDYGPDWTLYQAAKSAGVNLGTTRLPWKTNMYINNDRIRVAEGYRSDPIELD